MDKNTITGFILIALLLIGFSYFNQSTQETQALQTTATVEKNQPVSTPTIAKTNNEVDSTALFAKALTGEEQHFTLENNKVKILFNSKGASIEQVTLKEYNNQEHKPLVLFDKKDAHLDLLLATKTANLNISDYYFTPQAINDTTISFTLSNQQGEDLILTYSLLKDNYIVNCNITSTGLAPYCTPQTQTLTLNWEQKLRQQEKGYAFEAQHSSLTFKYQNESSAEQMSVSEDEDKKGEKQIDWVAYKNQYFSSVLIAYPYCTDFSAKSKILPEGSGYLKSYSSQMQIPFNPQGGTTELQFYFGPNKYLLLKDMSKYAHHNKELELQELVYLGWPVFRLFNRFFTVYVFDWLTQLGLSMGIVLLLITLLLRFIVYPFTRKSYISSAKMKVLKPKVDEINAKYPKPEDALRKQQEIMALYSNYGASPMGGCLPMLIQLPIWIAMFNFVPIAIELRQQSFLWASDLSTYDAPIHWTTSLPLIGNHLSLFCILFCVSNLVYTYLNMRMQKDSMMGMQNDQMKIMNYMMYLMPLIFFFTFNNYSAGLNYYYFLSLLTGALTMWYLRKTVDENKLLAKLEENFIRNQQKPPKMSSMMARLEAMRKQQEEILARQNKKT